MLILITILVFILLMKAQSATDVYLSSINTYNLATRTYSTIIRKNPQDYLKSKIVHYAYKLEDSLHISAELILAVISVESNYKIDAESNMHAYGLMQLQVPTAKYYIKNISADRLKSDWRANMLCGTLYLRDCINNHGYYKGILVYNGGPSILKKRKHHKYVNHNYYVKICNNM